MTTTADHASAGGAAGSGHRRRREDRGVRAPVDRAAHRQPHRPDEGDRDPLRHHPRPSLPPLRRTQPGDPHGPSPRRLAPVRRARHPGHRPDAVGSTPPGAVHPPPPGRPRPAEGAEATTTSDDLRHPGRQDLPAVAVPHPDLPSYGPVRPDGAPLDPGSYDYRRAARDALHFPGAARPVLAEPAPRPPATTCSTSPPSNPRRRLAPHVHIAIRGTIPRALIRAGRRRHLPPGLVAAARPAVYPRRPPAGLGRRHRRPTSTRTPASRCPPGRGPRRHRRRPDAEPRARGPLRRPGRRPRRHRRHRRRRAAASAT